MKDSYLQQIQVSNCSIFLGGLVIITYINQPLLLLYIYRVQLVSSVEKDYVDKCQPNNFLNQPYHNQPTTRVKHINIIKD